MPIQSTPEGSAPMPVGGEDEERGAPEGGAQANPVIDALKTIQMFIAAQKEKGNPKAQALIAWFQQGIQLMGGGGGQEKPMPKPEAAPEEGPQPEPMGKGMMPMGASKGSVPIV